MAQHMLQRSFKGQRRYKLDEEEVQSLEIPECLGQNVILHYLNLADTWYIRSVSKQFNSWAKNAVRCRRDLSLESHPALTFESFNVFISNVRQPRSLSLTNCKSLDIPQPTPALTSVLASLQELTIRKCEALNSNTLVLLLQHCSSLTHLNTDKLSVPAVVVLCETARHLRHLRADGSGAQFQDKALELVAKAPCLETLETLSLASCAVSNHAVEELLGQLKRPLCLLNLSDCREVTSYGVARALEGSGGLVEKVVLRRVKCTDALLSYASTSAAKELKELVLGYCSSLTNRVVADFGLSWAAKKIRVLEMNGACHVNADAFCRMVSHAQELRELQLTNCRQINDDFLFQLSYSCPKLEKLGIKSCDQVTDAGVRSLVQGCKGLQVLDFSCCFGLSDEGIQAVAAKCIDLRELLLFCCYSVSDESILEIARRCRKLEALDISWCYKVTSTSLSAVAKNCVGLRSMRLEGCRQISEFEAQNLVHLSHRLTNADVIRSSSASMAKDTPPSVLKRAESEGSMKPGSGQKSKKQLQRHRSVIHQVSLVHSSSKPKPVVGFSGETSVLSASVPTHTALFPRRRRPSMDFSTGFSTRKQSPREHYVSLDQLEKREQGRRKSLSGRRLWGEEDEDVARFNAFSIDDTSSGTKGGGENLTIGINSCDTGAISGSPTSASSTDAESVMFDMDEVALTSTKLPG